MSVADPFPSPNGQHPPAPLLPSLPISLSSPSCLSSLADAPSLLPRLNAHPVALALAIALATHGRRKGSLAPSGALAAFAVGYLTMANPLPLFGVVLIVFYLTGSRVTKVKADVKARLEMELEGLKPKPKAGGAAPHGEHKSSQGGARDMWQVLCNGLTGCLAAVSFRVLASGELPQACLSAASSPFPFLTPSLLGSGWQSGTAFCALDASFANGWGRMALMLALGHFGCCMGDVFASEVSCANVPGSAEALADSDASAPLLFRSQLGILSNKKPVLATAPWRVVPPGTNGGISAWGTFASALGGTWMSAVFIGSLWLWNGACSAGSSTTLHHLSVPGVVYLAALGTFAGFAGSMVSDKRNEQLQPPYCQMLTCLCCLSHRFIGLYAPISPARLGAWSNAAAHLVQHADETSPRGSIAATKERQQKGGCSSDGVAGHHGLGRPDQQPGKFSVYAVG